MRQPLEAKFETSSKTKIPKGFEGFTREQEHLLQGQVTDLLPAAKKHAEFASIMTLALMKLESRDNFQGDVVFVADGRGRRAVMAIYRDTILPELDDIHIDGVDDEILKEIYRYFRVIGGMGAYDSPDTLKHTLDLATAMRMKTFIAGLRRAVGLSGMKATFFPDLTGTDGKFGWMESEDLQRVTGWLFSQEGPFKNAITGTDVGQGTVTIGIMSEGSALGSPNGKNHQIAGDTEIFSTPRACRHSFEATYQVLWENKNRIDGEVPQIEEARVVVQGFGNVGQTAVEWALDSKAKTIIIADTRLTDEAGNILPKSPLYKIYLDLNKKAEKAGQEIIVVAPDAIYDQEDVDIFMPCSSQEEMLDFETLDRLKRAKVKLILAGANNILNKETMWQAAHHANKVLKIILPHEVFSNCGGVSMAGLGPLYDYFRQNNPDYMNLSEEEAQLKFVNYVADFIMNNARAMFQKFLQISEEFKTDIYTAVMILYCREFDISFQVEDGVLRL